MTKVPHQMELEYPHNFYQMAHFSQAAAFLKSLACQQVDSIDTWEFGL
jgi:hypothetical protein